MPEPTTAIVVAHDDPSTEIVETDELPGGAALAALNRSEIDVQIRTAKKFPRSITSFKRQALEMATLDEETAGSMFYALPRSGKTVEGPSVRLAEIAASAWGNLRYGARVIEIGDQWVTSQGFCFDLEKNIACTVEAKRRITDKHGKRYNEDMIGVTSQAANAVALRNAIFKVIPFAYVSAIYDSAKETAIGKAMTMEQRRTRALGWYAKSGAPEKKVLELLGRASVEEISIDDLTFLQGLRTAISDGEMTFDGALAAKKGEAEPSQAGMPARQSATAPATPPAAGTPPGATAPPEEATTGDLPLDEAPSPAPAAAPAAPPPRAANGGTQSFRVKRAVSVSLPKSKGGGTVYEISLDDGRVLTSSDPSIYRAAAAAEEAEAQVHVVVSGSTLKMIQTVAKK